MPASSKVEFPGRDRHLLAGRLELPDGVPRATAVFAHCFTCSKDSAAAVRISRALSARGFAVLRFDFTGLGGSGGDFANTDFSSNVGDLIAAADHLRGTRSAPCLLVGHSLGGLAVLVAAASIPEVRAVATIGAPSSLAHLAHVLRSAAPEIEASGRAEVELAGRRFTLRREFLADLSGQDLLPRLRDLRRAVLLMHSPVDEIVDVDHARRLFEALVHPKSFLSLDDATHLLNDRRDAEYVADVLAAWASRYLPEPDGPARA
jgi:putative redox protein